MSILENVDIPMIRELYEKIASSSTQVLVWNELNQPSLSKNYFINLINRFFYICVDYFFLNATKLVPVDIHNTLNGFWKIKLI